MKLTVTVITRNEAANLAGALESVKWADEIVVVDSRSSDETVEIARRYATRVEVHDWKGYSAQRNYAAEIAANDWILAIDADERVPQALADEILEILRTGPNVRGYRMPRVSFYLGRWIKGTDWYPDYQLRLYDRRVGQFNGKRVHESVELSDGRPGTLKNDLQHYPYRDISDHVTSIDHYTTLAAEEWSAAGRRTGVLDVVLHPPAAFLRNYILRGGFRDGMPGFLISVLNSVLRLPQDPEALGNPVRLARRDARVAGGRRRKFERAPNADQPPGNPRLDDDQSPLQSPIDNPPSNRRSAVDHRH